MGSSRGPGEPLMFSCCTGDLSGVPLGQKRSSEKAGNNAMHGSSYCR